MAIFLKSLSEQLADAREEAGESFLWAHIDTCLSCYLNDHHHRDGELLLGAFVDGSSTVSDVLDSLSDEFHTIAYDLAANRAGYDHDAAKAALDRLIDENSDRLERPFDSSLESPTEDEDDDCSEYAQAWFLLTWEVPEEPEPSD